MTVLFAASKYNHGFDPGQNPVAWTLSTVVPIACTIGVLWYRL